MKDSAQETGILARGFDTEKHRRTLEHKDRGRSGGQQT